MKLKAKVYFSYGCVFAIASLHSITVCGSETQNFPHFTCASLFPVFGVYHLRNRQDHVFDPALGLISCRRRFDFYLLFSFRFCIYTTGLTKELRFLTPFHLKVVHVFVVGHCLNILGLSVWQN